LSTPQKSLVAEVVAIGDELTTGQRLDTNTQWLSERLTELGYCVMYHTTVADDLEANIAVFQTAIERADVVVATGGLGPTADDLTRDALAATVDVQLAFDDTTLDYIRGLFERRGRVMPERNVVQAMFPEGSQQIFNPIGTAPGIRMQVERTNRQPCHLFALPGVPAEMFLMWEQSVVSALVEMLPALQVIRHRRINCFGAGESHIEEMLPDVIRRGREPLVGITASGATIKLRITASGDDEVACFKAMEPTVREIYELLGELVFGEEADELEHAVIRLLNQHQATLAVAEWSTAGRLAELLAAADDVQASFVGGMVIQNRASLESLLSIDGSADLTVTEVASAMAESIRQQTGTDFSLAISGATRVDDNTQSIGIALAGVRETQTKKVSTFGDPEFDRLRTAKVAMNLLRLAMLKQG
jgi:nicotinamide-nucleotide amidase